MFGSVDFDKCVCLCNRGQSQDVDMATVPEVLVILSMNVPSPGCVVLFGLLCIVIIEYIVQFIFLKKRVEEWADHVGAGQVWGWSTQEALALQACHASQAEGPRGARSTA